ncbi:exportin-6-like isoform X2 [Lineus longissimus]
MGNTGNEYVMMYCMTVLENLINKQWIGFQGQDKMEIRSTINRLLLSHHDKVPSYIRNKLVKLVVDIGRLDWPHFYPDFFSSILQLMQQHDTVLLGLVLIQTASEELACPREDLSVARKEELRRLLLQQVPAVLSLINTILESTLEKHRHLVMATPPPSPTHGEATTTHRRSSFTLFSTSPQSSAILSNMFKSPSNKVQLESLPPLDSSSHVICATALNCLSHLFSWIPLSTTITPSLLSTIFRFCGFGCEIQQQRPSGSSPGNTFAGSNQSLGVLAMNCINELLAKNCVPQEFEDFLLQMFQQTFYLLQKLTKESGTSSTGNRLEELDENYIEKFTEFLRLFVSIHLRRFESNTQFPVLDFLSLLFKYTFKQPTNDGFFACLDIWCVFLDYISTMLKARHLESNNILTRYKDPMAMLLTQVLHKCQFRYNQSQLDELDDETLDEDSETEWQHFLRQCLELIAKVAELMPTETFRILLEPLGEYSDIYLGLEQFIANGVQGRRLNITAENECRRLHCTMRDLSSLLQALGRLGTHFIGEHFADRFGDAQALVERLIRLVVYGTKLKLYEVNSVAQNVLQSDFIEVHAQALATLKAYSHWLSQFGMQSQSHNDHKEKFFTIMSTVIDSLLPLFEKDVPEKIVQSAAHLMVSVCITIRPPFLLQIPDIQKFFSAASQGSCCSFSNDVQTLIYRSLSHYLILPWPNITESDQQWADRSTMHQTFMKQLTSQYRQLKDSTTLSDDKNFQDQVKPCIKKTLQVLTDIIESLAGEVVKSKQICYQSIQEPVQVSLQLFSIYIHQPDVMDSILTFFLALFQSQRVQMGIPFTEQVIRTFMDMFTREQLAEIILSESRSGIRVIEKFLKVLELIVQEPGSAFKAFLPTIISLIMEHIYPIIAERSSPDIKSSVYETLHQLLLHNWRYFFKGNILTTMQKTQAEEVENQPQFVTIMQAFGQSFLQPDIAIFKQNLEALESLNTKWKLFHRKIFIELMLDQFLNVLLQVLVHKSHDLLQEEIGITVYNMASVDFERFYSTFLPQFLTNCEGLDNNQKAILAQNFKMDKDLPSFTQSVHRIVNDLRYYRLCNSSLPAGSVRF